MKWRTIFDATRGVTLSSGATMALELGAVLACLGLLWVLIAHRSSWTSRATIAGWGAIVVGLLLVTSIGGYWTYGEATASTFKDDTQNGRCRVVSGKVKLLNVESSSGHSLPERIQISGVTFQYSEFTLGLGYHRTVLHGSMLRDGMLARVLYCPQSTGNVIIRVEVPADIKRIAPGRQSSTTHLHYPWPTPPYSNPGVATQQRDGGNPGP